MSEKQHRDKIASLKRQEASLEGDRRKAREAAAKYRATASSKLSRITPRTSDTMERSYRREAESAEKNALREDAKVVSATKKLADIASAISSAQSSLEREIKAADSRRAREESAAASKRRQDDDRRRRDELSHARA